MNNLPIKTEPGIKPEPMDMKLEEDDEGLYEETGDLDMTLAGTGVWLVKVPNWLMERWNEIDDDEEIQIGTIRVRSGGEDATKLRLSLTDVPANEGLPKNFDMNVTNMAVENTFIFTEKDLPGFETKPKPDGPEIPARLIYQQRREREAAAKKAAGQNPDGRFQPYARKSIPKRTALVGTVRHECSIVPIESAHYRNFMTERANRFLEPKFKTRRLEENEVVNNLASGSLGRIVPTAFDNWIQPTADKRKPQDQKAARMPKNELIDALFACFREYPYWPIKALKERLNQPEAYLKSTLEEIANLRKSGKFALKWCLKPEYVQHTPEQLEAMEQSGKAMAPSAENDDDDDEVEMEDVKL
ncbi:transcription initiation factor IIF, beta subunit [Ascobolus immersus RN42]|uniref:Transcription initiation factor IIF subunit beta n=1 Tax=Ascobolus immersus RN42 TaxID=1160509 RepID=A0A3N4IHD8_ASCIM|nr:transcription initiation factor IIF, beta subunit [Ascobolus immersus RN42]